MCSLALQYLALHFQKNGIPIMSNACHAGVAEKQRVEIMSSPRNVPPSPRLSAPSPRVDTPIPTGAGATDASPLSLPLGSIARPVSPGIPGAPAPAPSPSSAPTPRNEPCRYYLQGHCLRGDRCQYLHVAPETLTPEEVEKYKPTPSPRSAPLVSPRSKPVPATPSKTALAMSGGEIPTLNAGPRPTSPRPDPPASPNSKASGGGPSPRPTEAFWATSLEQVTGQIVKTAKDQLGCRFLQKLLDDKIPNALEAIYAEARFLSLMDSALFVAYCLRAVAPCLWRSHGGCVR